MINVRRLLLIMVVTVLASVLFLAGCSGDDAAPGEGASLEEQAQTVPVGDAGTYTDVSVEGLATMMEEKSFPLVNVHIPYEGEIEGTDLFIPYNEIEQNLEQLPEEKDARIVLYCRSGSMSAQAARELVELGYTDVWNVDGGMIAWENSGRPLLNR
ncbi:MAG: rhodanese-like domain-containing protein [Chloroflexota bacterium]